RATYRVRPIIPDPAGEAFFIHLARSEGEDHCRGALRRDQEIYIVETQKHDDRAEGCPFITIDEQMISGNAVPIRRGERSEVSFAISEFVDGTAECRFQHALVANAVW